MIFPEHNPVTRDQFRDLLLWRRDVRRFQSTPVPDAIFQDLLALVHLAPSVGLSEPWRFVHVKSSEKRSLVRQEFERANAQALAGYEGEQKARYAQLKLAGLDQAPLQLAVFADRATQQGSGLGRQSMPEMLEYSVVCAITTLWLSARTYGLGLGWLSILDPENICAIAGSPPTWRFVAYLCLGYPETESTTPELTRAGWEARSPNLPKLIEI